MTRVEEESEKMGMTLNEHMAESMVITKKEGLLMCDILVSDKPIEQRQSYRCLGSILTEDYRYRNKIKSRIAPAENCFINLRKILRNKKLNITALIRVPKCYI